MPIYAYRCEACGFAEDVLQKMSADPLTVCPSCGKDAFRKQVTAAGFQLKGSGWYVTDFRNGSGNGGKAGAPAATEAKDGGSGTAADSSAAATPASAPAATATSAAAASPAAGAAAPAPASTPASAGRKSSA